MGKLLLGLLRPTQGQASDEADDHLGFVDGTVAGSAFSAIRPDRPDVVFGLVTQAAGKAFRFQV